MSLFSEIETLKKEKNAIILAHYYVPDEVQVIADFVGDSFALAKKLKKRMPRSSFCRSSVYGRKC